MTDRSDRHRVLYWNRATPELYAVIREQAPPELEPVFIETENPAEAREKLARAEFLIIADWALGPADLEGAPRLRMVQHQGVGYERIDTQALAARKIPLCLCPAGTATGVGEHTMTLILAVLKQVVLAPNALVHVARTVPPRDCSAPRIRCNEGEVASRRANSSARSPNSAATVA